MACACHLMLEGVACTLTADTTLTRGISRSRGRESFTGQGASPSLPAASPAMPTACPALPIASPWLALATVSPMWPSLVSGLGCGLGGGLISTHTHACKAGLSGMQSNEGGRNLVESEHMGSPTTFSLTVINTGTVFAVNYTTTITNKKKRIDFLFILLGSSTMAVSCQNHWNWLLELVSLLDGW